MSKKQIYWISAIVLFVVAIALFATLSNSWLTGIVAFAALIMVYLADKQTREERIEKKEQDAMIREIQANASVGRYNANQKRNNNDVAWVCTMCSNINPGKNNYCQNCGNKR